MPRSKLLLKSAKHVDKGKDKQELPATADEYLAAGVNNEEAGEKWRAGDAAKSTRFFVRALDKYEGGLQLFPRNFDLAYNKARLQYDLAQQPRLLDQLPYSLIELLNIALESHRYALNVDQYNADLLFNTAQVLTSIAEASMERRSAEATLDGSLRLLQEALEIFQRCLSLQENKLTPTEDVSESASQRAWEVLNVVPEPNQCSPQNAVEEEVWAFIEEPVTNDSLLETLFAQMGTLITICSISSNLSKTNIGWIEEYYLEMLQPRIEFLSSTSARLEEISLMTAKFKIAFADASFHVGTIDILTYERELNAVSADCLDSGLDEQSLCDRADAEIAFVTSVLALLHVNSNAAESEVSQLHNLCWRHTTKALDDLTAATKLSQAENLPRSHLRRGDCELIRYGLGKFPLPYELAVRSAPTLIKNAETFYRGAAKLAHISGALEEEREALIKEAAVLKLSGSPEKFGSVQERYKELTHEVVRDMQDEYLLCPQDIERLSE